MTEKKPTKPGPKKWMNFPLFVIYGLSLSIGASLFTILGITASKAGLYSPLTFILPAITIGLTAFSYAEFATRHPLAGGEMSYADEAFGISPLTIITGILVILTGIATAALLVMGAAAYSENLMPFLPSKIILGGVFLAVSVIALAGLLNFSASVFLMGIGTITGIVFFLFYGIRSDPALLSNVDNLIPPMQWSAWKGIFLGSFFAFLPFIGLNDVTNMPDKIKSPKLTVPYGLITVIILTLFLFLLISSLLILITPLISLAASDAPFSLAVQSASVQVNIFFNSLVVLLLINGAALQIFRASKVIFNLALTGRLPHIFMSMNKVTKTAQFAILALMGVVGSLIYTISLITLAEIASGLTLLLFALINFSLIRQKWGGIEIPNFNAYSTKLWVPITGLFCCLLMIGIGIWGRWFA
ncbi:MAG: amino acid permease [Sneathiella sp.]|nr:amino acid permease [Sneathiella sp.]